MFQSVAYAVFIEQFYTKLLHRSSWSWSFFSAKFQPNRFGNKKLTRILKSSLNRMCHIAQPVDKSNWIEPISHKLFPTYPSDIFPG